MVVLILQLRKKLILSKTALNISVFFDIFLEKIFPFFMSALHSNMVSELPYYSTLIINQCVILDNFNHIVLLILYFRFTGIIVILRYASLDDHFIPQSQFQYHQYHESTGSLLNRIKGKWWPSLRHHSIFLQFHKFPSSFITNHIYYIEKLVLITAGRVRR